MNVLYRTWPAVLCNCSCEGNRYLIAKSTISRDQAAPATAVFTAVFRRCNLHQNPAVGQGNAQPKPDNVMDSKAERTSKPDKDYLKLVNYLIKQEEPAFVLFAAASIEKQSQ